MSESDKTDGERKGSAEAPATHYPTTDEIRQAQYERGLIGDKSPGVLRIEAISAHLTLKDRVFVFFGVFLIAYAYGLDGQIRSTYQVCPVDQQTRTASFLALRL